MLLWSGKMTTSKNKKGLVGGKSGPMKWLLLAKYRQSSHDAEPRYADYGKENPHGIFDGIKPKTRSGSDNVAYLNELRRQTTNKRG